MVQFPDSYWKLKGVAFVSGERWDKRQQEIIDLIGSPDEFHQWIIFGPTNKMQDIAQAAAFFPSKARAMVNGWRGDIKSGFDSGVFGQQKVPWVIANVFPHWDDDWYWSDANPLWQEYANPKDYGDKIAQAQEQMEG